MNKLTDKCCPKCIDSEFQRCPKFTECLAKRPLPECHTDEACVEKRNAVIHKIRYGEGILLKLSMGGDSSDVDLGNIISTLFAELRRRELVHVSLAITGGLGNYQDAPFLLVCDPEYPTIVYAQVTAEKIPRILTDHIEQRHIVEEWVLGQFPDDEKKLLDSVPVIQYLDFFRSQTLRISKRCGVIDPDHLDEFFLEGGFLSLSKALNRMETNEIVNLIGVSGLRGRGGSGDYVVKKWMRMLASLESSEKGSPDARHQNTQRYLICNAHEGYEPAMKDRHLLEGDPFALVEGMAVTAYAVQATEGIIYINPEYDLAIKRLQNALQLARKYNYLGKEILGTDFSFEIELRRAPSGYLSGEETSVVSFLEGDIGTRPVPPYLETRGLWGQPTLIHNVETFLNVSLLVQHDFSWFASTGMSDNPGTTCLTLFGAVKRPGIIEISLGTPLNTIVSEIGGGIRGDYPLKAVHIGGPIGGYLPPDLLDISFDHDTLQDHDIRIGAGTIEGVDQSTCIVQRVYNHFQSTLQELCGQCTAGREGIYQITAVLHALCEGRDMPGCRTERQNYLDLLEELAAYIQHAGLCVYCKYATSSLVTSMRYFRREYEEHLQKRCQAGICFK